MIWVMLIMKSLQLVECGMQILSILFHIQAVNTDIMHAQLRINIIYFTTYFHLCIRGMLISHAKVHRLHLL